MDEAAGPVVRPYAMTRGRTRPDGAARMDVASMVLLVDRAGPAADTSNLDPEHRSLLEAAHERSLSVADAAASLDLPLGVVRVLIGDLLAAGLIRVRPPLRAGDQPDQNLLHEVREALRHL